MGPIEQGALHAAHEGAVEAEVGEVLRSVGRAHLVLLPHIHTHMMCMCMCMLHVHAHVTPQQPQV